MASSGSDPVDDGFTGIVTRMTESPGMTYEPEEGGGAIRLSQVVTLGGGVRLRIESAGAVLTDRDAGVLAALLLAQSHSPALGSVKTEALVSRLRDSYLRILAEAQDGTITREVT